MLLWSDPIELQSYAAAPTGPGIYAIGTPENLGAPVVAGTVHYPYLGRWPDNLVPLYVGISESRRAGIRGRLSSHWRGKGNKGVAEHRKRGSPLWFVTVAGPELIVYESLLLCLQNTTQFACNVRKETERNAVRQAAAIRIGMSDRERLHYDQLDMGEHGEGM